MAIASTGYCPRVHAPLDRDAFLGVQDKWGLTLRIQRKLAGTSPGLTENAVPMIADSGDGSAMLAVPECVAPSFLAAMGNLPRGKSKAMVQKGSKAAVILALVSQPGGATGSEIMRITGGAAHSVRGFISGVVMKRMGKDVESIGAENGDRLYRINEH